MSPRCNAAAAIISLVFLVVGAGLGACGSGPRPPVDEAEESAASDGQSDLSRTVPSRIDPLYRPWTRVLRTWVDEEGLVDYAGLQRQGRADLETFIDAIAEVDPAALDSDAHRIAFWINAYNATVLWQVVGAYPIDSVREVGSLWGLLGGFFEQENLIAGADRSLDDIEHGILRTEYPDPEIHWTLVCAALGCPRLIRRPYVADDLDPLLDELAHEFLARPRALRIDREAGVLHVSRYFDWYADDFRSDSGTIVDYLLQYAPEETAGWIREHRDGLRVEFMDYDWTLNDQAGGPRASR